MTKRIWLMGGIVGRKRAENVREMKENCQRNVRRLGIREGLYVLAKAVREDCHYQFDRSGHVRLGTERERRLQTLSSSR